MIAVINYYGSDIVAVSGTLPKNAKDPIQDCERNIHGYQNFNNHQYGKRGVCIYVKSHLGASNIDVVSCDHLETIFCEISLEKDDKLLIGCIYRSPNTSGIADEEMRNLILSCSARSYSHLLLMGDYNYPEISWDPIRLPEDHMHPATLFVECLRDAYLYQHVTNPTHSTAEQKANTLDLILTNEESMVEDLTHEPPLGKSHHDCLVFKFRCYSKRNINVQRKSKLNLGDYKGLAINWEDLLTSHGLTSHGCGTHYPES